MQPVTTQTLKVFWKHTLRYKKSLVIIILTIVLGSAMNVSAPLIIRELFDALTEPSAAWVGREFDLIWMMLGLAVLIQVNYRVMFYLVNFLQPRVMSDLYNTCYKYTIGHSYGFFADNFAGAITTRVRRFQNSYEKITDIVTFDLSYTALRILFILIMLFLLHAGIGALALAWVIIFVFVAYWFSQYKMRFDLKLAEQDTKTTAHLADTIANSINLKLYGSQDRESSSFAQLTDRLYRLRQHSWNLSNYFNLPQGLLMTGLEFGAMYIALTQVKAGQMSVGELVMLQAFLGGIFERLWNVTNSMKNLYEGLADANEMTEMLMKPHEVADRPDAKELAVKNGRIEFQNVSFQYHGGNRIFNGFSLAVKPGEKIALVGRSGSGKSTAVKLLLRLKDIHGGAIRIDGQDISQVAQDSLRLSIAHVPQDPILFHRSLMDNIRYGRADASDEEVIAAAKAAHAHEFISGFQAGYDTLVGERGIKLSGGERQRVAIARAILQDAPILILDEATSSLDSEAEAFIQDGLDTLMKGKTTIVIAHRLSTIRKMDRIIVMNSGRIIEEGTHDDLLKLNQSTYQRLWEIQVNGFANVGV